MISPELIKAVGYIRRSRSRQEKSLEDQKKEILKYAKAHGIVVIKFFEDDGISGWRGEKLRGLQDMIKEAETPGRSWTLVIAWDMTRVGRMVPDEKAYYRHLLKKQGVGIVYVGEQIPDGTIGSVIRTIRDVEASDFLVKLSKDVLRGQVSAAEQGSRPSAGPPHGYDLGHFDRSGKMFQRIRYLPDARKEVYLSDGTLVRTLSHGESAPKGRHAITILVKGNPVHVRVMIQIFKWAAQGWASWKIAATLNSEGVPAPRGPGWGPATGLWTRYTIDEMLRNPEYIGIARWNHRSIGKFHKVVDGSAVPHEGTGRAVENPKDQWFLKDATHEAIIDRETFFKVQALVEQRASKHTREPYRSGRAKHSEFMLSGVLRCARCGHPIWGSSPKGKPCYMCSGYQTYGKSVCSRIAFDRTGLEKVVMEVLAARVTQILDTRKESLVSLVSELLDSDSGQLEAETQRLTEVLADTKRKIRHALDLIDERNRVLINDELAELQRRRSEAEERLARLKAQGPSVDRGAIAEEVARLAATFQQVMAKGSLIERKEFIRAYIHRIELDGRTGQGTIQLRPLPLPEARCELSFGGGGSWSSTAQKTMVTFRWKPPARKLVVHFEWDGPFTAPSATA